MRAHTRQGVFVAGSSCYLIDGDILVHGYPWHDTTPVSFQGWLLGHMSARGRAYT
jgi:hypothetical protein